MSTVVFPPPHSGRPDGQGMPVEDWECPEGWPAGDSYARSCQPVLFQSAPLPPKYRRDDHDRGRDKDRDRPGRGKGKGWN